MSEPNPRPIFGTAGMQWGTRAYVRAVMEAFPLRHYTPGRKGGPWTEERIGLREFRPHTFHGKHSLSAELETEEERNQFNREVSQDFGAGFRNHRNPVDWNGANGEVRELGPSLA